MGNDNIRNYGFDSDIDVVVALPSTVIQGGAATATGDAIDTRLYPRARILFEATWTAVTPSAYAGDFQPMESETSDGTFTAADFSASRYPEGFASPTTATMIASIRRNVDKPWMKAAVDSNGADCDGIATVNYIFINQGV